LPGFEREKKKIYNYEDHIGVTCYIVGKKKKKKTWKILIEVFVWVQKPVALSLYDLH
jgi:hypothetical protein